jgi:serine/threonine protein kinase
LGSSGVVREVKRIFLLDELHCSYSTFNASLTTNSIGSVQNEAQSENENYKDSDVENPSYHFTSRHGLAALCKRNGFIRNAVKNINVKDASIEQQARTRIDLAIEVSYLKVLPHLHIVRIRGSLNTSNPFHPQFFFLMDKLNGTLFDKICEWDQRIKRKRIDLMQFALVFSRIGKRSSLNQELLKERLSVAHDIASAFSYMHHRKVIHR